VFTIAASLTARFSMLLTNLATNIRIVLVETSHPGNIGAAARAMANMGLLRLVLVKPKRWPAQEAISMAASALHVLEAAVVVESLAEAVADCHLVIGTSARLRTMPIPLLDPATSAQKVQSLPSHQQVALVFGREISGLSNEELHQCHYHVHIPVNPEYSSLNLAAAVMVLSYELRKALLAVEAEAVPPMAVEPQTNKQSDKVIDDWDQEPATASELERYFQHLEQVLIRLDFHQPENKRPLMRRLRRLYQRQQLDKMEVNILRGMLTAIEKALEKGAFPKSLPADKESKS
jgi:tRNA (cytidine32/uridine32-2'-O)-methyltransferase